MGRLSAGPVWIITLSAIALSPVTLSAWLSFQTNPGTPTRASTWSVEQRNRESTVERLYEESKCAMQIRGCAIRSYFSSALSDYDNAMHGYPEVMAMDKLPLQCFKSSTVRGFWSQNLVRVMFELVVRVKKLIADELTCAKGVVLFEKLLFLYLQKVAEPTRIYWWMSAFIFSQTPTY